MKNLLYKEFTLAMHPTVLMFLALSALVLIPNYPYYVTFFYTTLGIFFTCLNGRENNDIFYTMSLPICKKDIVKSRFLFVIVIEMLQMLLTVPFAIIRSTFPVAANQAGIEANTAFFGFSFILLGLFNLVFFINYYKDPKKIGTSFIWSNVAMWLFILLAESSVFAVPFMRDYVDTLDPLYMPIKLLILASGIIIFLLLTYVSYRKSIKSLEALDL